MSTSTLSTQGLAPGCAPTISIVHLHHRDCRIILDALDVGSQGTKVLGVCLRLSKCGFIEAIALATPTTVFLVSLSKAGAQRSLRHVLQDPRCVLAGAGIARLALILHRNTGAHVRGAELLTLPAKPSGKQISPADLASTYLSSQMRHQYRRIHGIWLRNSNNDICLKAWLLACVAEKAIDQIAKVVKVDTGAIPARDLACLSQLVLNVELLDADKPTFVDNEFDTIGMGSDGHAVLRNARYKTRVRASASTVIEINGGEAHAQAVSTKGKSTGLAILKGKLPTKVEKVRVIGREEATSAERGRDDHVLCVLQGRRFLNTSPFVQMLWFELSEKVAVAALPSLIPKEGIKQSNKASPAFSKLNPSQRKVAMAMISYVRALVVAHGPPGTGKTSTIAAALEHWQNNRQAAWVVAHSNVGVQNIAESLYKRQIDFKIIVSQEFHFEWHEHLYEEIEHLVIRTDEFGQGFDAKNAIGDTKVILCTLSMLSNPSLHLNGVFKHVPVARLIVDEASQIDTFEFMHLFDMFTGTLGKVCMFGDPKQLPPFGAEVAPKMKTIFDFKHLKKQAHFLDTQYRMPVPLGNFISQAVYESRLKSHHTIKASSCVLFVDVRKGHEEHVGSSWKNTEEVNTIVNIAKTYYKNAHFCVITPYDAQRAAISAALKAAGVARHEHVYNVDSFQGRLRLLSAHPSI
ncbi:P-loop containing nucleoside triphosphate hydrolase protein [Lentinus tigrinus ALCF2SS1-7]|uniref:P-loop containing nucleoside triphosphate hydrolase protein n=1 Tax=Lentinus tigrinus ALCF2SS1-6 TaxID=1328759 RepID=A0A5C2S3L0_9APHY|nr:P-loop containing nucleoside triphosphate hydrolase protein [Lentinus tigrinus ALCF2SS1-6]RPD72250.1 P-loop containing nucleoside triphosphate hydrolase protein [Lentinus tigrinus ALCF2SS1-7]